MTPNCDTYRDDLIAYRDGELPPLRRWLVRWHLAHCAACREELMIMEQISEKIRSSESETLGPTATLDPALRHKILSSVATAPDTGTAPLTDNKIEQADRDSTATVTPRARPSVLWREWAAIGACVLFFGVAFVTMRGTRLKGGFSTAASAINTSTGGADESAPDTFRSPVAAGGAGIHYNGGLTERDTTPSSGAGGAASSSDNFAPGAIKTTPSSSTSSAAAPSAHRSLAKGEVLYADGRVRWNRNVTGSPTIPPGAFSTDNMPSSLRRVHKEGRLTVEVAKVEEQSDAVTQMVKSAGGFVADNQLTTGGDGLKTASLTIRVPVKQFESIMGQISKLGEVKAKNVTGEDITEKFSDVETADRILGSELGVKESQLKAALQKEALRKKKVSLVPWEQRAEVRELRIQAAQMRARLTLLKRISDLANISVELTEKAHSPKATGVLGDLSDTTASAYETFGLAARVPVNLVIWLLAYSPLWAPVLVAFFFLNRIYSHPAPKS